MVKTLNVVGSADDPENVPIAMDGRLKRKSREMWPASPPGCKYTMHFESLQALVGQCVKGEGLVQLNIEIGQEEGQKKADAMENVEENLVFDDSSIVKNEKEQ